MDIILYTTDSEPQELNKRLANDTTFSGSFRSEVSVLRPIIRIEHEIPVPYNYCYINALGRYYFIDDIISVRTNLWDLHLRVDVLMSHRQGILNSKGILSDSESVADDMYSPGSQWATKVKKKTDIVRFPQGFGDYPTYILITSGGIAT